MMMVTTYVWFLSEVTGGLLAYCEDGGRVMGTRGRIWQNRMILEVENPRKRSIALVKVIFQP